VGALVRQKEEEIEFENNNNVENTGGEQAITGGTVQSGAPVSTPMLMISGLPEDATEAFVDELLILYGAVLHCELLPGGRAMVSMESIEEARRVAETFHEDGITVRLATAADDAEKQDVKPDAEVQGQVQDADDVDTEIHRRVPPPPPLVRRPASADTSGGGGNDAGSPSLLLGGLPHDATEDLVACIMAAHAEVVSCKLLPDKGKGRSALVQVAGVGEAKAAINGLNGFVPDGLDQPLSLRYRGVTPGSSNRPSSNLYVSGLPVDCTNDLLDEIFGRLGNITRFRLLPQNCQTERAALVQMGNIEEARIAIASLDGQIPDELDNVLTVRYADNRTDRGRNQESRSRSGHAPSKRWNPYENDSGSWWSAPSSKTEWWSSNR